MRRKERRALRRLLYLWLASQLRWDWDPLSWANAAIKEAVSIEKVIWQWVVKISIDLGNLVVAVSQDIYDFIAAEVAIIDSNATWAFDQINNLLSDIESIAWTAIDGLALQVKTWAHDVVKDVAAAGGWLWNEIDGFAKWAVKEAHLAAVWEWHHIWLPVVNALIAGIHDIGALSDKVWQDWKTDVWAPLKHDWNEGWHDAKKAIHWIDHSGMDAVHLVEHCWAWLEALKNHPFDMLESLPANLAKLITKEWAEKASGGAGSLWDELVKATEGIF